MEPEFRCYTDPRPKLPGGRLVTVTSMPRELTSVRYAFHPAARAAENWIDDARWHDADGFHAEGDFLRFQVPASVAHGLERGERYAIAVCDANAKGMIRGEISWPEHPERWDDGAEPYSEPSPEIEAEAQGNRPEEEAPAGGGAPRWVVIILVVLGLAGGGWWWSLQGRDLEVAGDTPGAPPPRANSAPSADTINVRVAPGAAKVVDIRDFAHDPEGQETSLASVASAQFGTVERIDDHSFRYRAPDRTSETDDIFLYRIQDPEGASAAGWVYVTVTSTDPVAEPAAEAKPVAAERAPSPEGPAEPKQPKQPNPEVPRLREEIAGALEKEDFDRVKALCGSAILLDAQLAKFCGIAFDPSKRLFDAKPDPQFALQCYKLAIDFGEKDAKEHLKELTAWISSNP